MDLNVIDKPIVAHRLNEEEPITLPYIEDGTIVYAAKFNPSKQIGEVYARSLALSYGSGIEVTVSETNNDSPSAKGSYLFTEGIERGNHAHQRFQRVLAAYKLTSQQLTKGREKPKAFQQFGFTV
jgi:hypothetical protein